MIGNDWDIILKSVFESEGFNKFLNVIKDRYKNSTCFPKYEDIFNALKLTPFKDVKVEIAASILSYLATAAVYALYASL